MKQFFVFIHSKFSQPSLRCDAIIKSLSPELNINYLSIDCPQTRDIIKNDVLLDIRLVPCLLIVNTDGKVSKYEGKKCFEYLSEHQKQQTLEQNYQENFANRQQTPPPPPIIVKQKEPQQPPPPQKKKVTPPPPPPSFCPAFPPPPPPPTSKISHIIFLLNTMK